MSLSTFLSAESETVPLIFQNLETVHFQKGKPLFPLKDLESLKKTFPHTIGKPLLTAAKGSIKKRVPLVVGVVLSGGQAAGGHDVICGLLDALHQFHPESRLYGFLGGPLGIINNKYKELTKSNVAHYRRQGGFDLLGSGRTKIETDEQFSSALKVCSQLGLQGLVVIGGDDSNTNAAFLSEYFLNRNSDIAVVGVPKTIDGDLMNDYVATSFGFDTACKIYSELIGNLASDALSAKKYTHFIKLMGRSASHIALECALATHPNGTLIGEEVAFNKKTLKEIVSEMSDTISKRSERGKDYSIFLIPEGLIEFIPEIGLLIEELNQNQDPKKLTEGSRAVFTSLPKAIQTQLLQDRDSHGNVHVSSIETEKLLIDLVKLELEQRHFKGKFSPVSHFFGYEGRAGYPSRFDSRYSYALGQTAALLVSEKATGYMAFVGDLTLPINDWSGGGVPLTHLMQLEKRKGKLKPVIGKAFVDLEGKPFELFAKQRDSWALKDDYQFPGPIQFFGPSALTDSVPLSLRYRCSK